MKKITLWVMATLLFVSLLSVSCASQTEMNQLTDKTELWPAYSNGKYGFINRKGQFEIPAQYDFVSSFSCGYAIVVLNGTYMFIDTSGKIKNTMSNSMTGVMTFNNNYCTIAIDGKYGIIDKDFNYVIQPFYYRLGTVAANGLVFYRLSYDDKYGYINYNGEPKIQSNYDGVGYFVGNYATVQVGNYCGIINASGEYTFQPIYQYIYPVGNDLFIYYSEDERWGLLNANGEIVVPAIYYIDDEVLDYNWNLLLVFSTSNEKAGYIDRNGDLKIPMQYDDATQFLEGYAYAEVNDKGMIIDETGKTVLPLADGEYVYSEGMHNGLMLTKRGDNYYYKDITGHVVYTWTVTGNSSRAPKSRKSSARLTPKERIVKDILRDPKSSVYFLGSVE